jgi:hypothetical protein
LASSPHSSPTHHLAVRVSDHAARRYPSSREAHEPTRGEFFCELARWTGSRGHVARRVRRQGARAVPIRLLGFFWCPNSARFVLREQLLAFLSFELVVGFAELIECVISLCAPGAAGLRRNSARAIGFQLPEPYPGADSDPSCSKHQIVGRLGTCGRLDRLLGCVCPFRGCRVVMSFLPLA